MSRTSEDYLNKQPKKGGVSHAPMSATSENGVGVVSAGAARAEAKPRLKFKAHSLKWSYKITGPHRPQRGRFKRVQMRNWERRIWPNFNGAAIVANLHTLEIWLTSRSYSSPERMYASAAMRADFIRRQFSKFQEIALELIAAPHPEGMERAHLVIDEKKHGPHFKHFKGQFDRPDSSRVGLTTDKSDAGLVELNGPMSAEGGLGIDWLALIYPSEWRGFKYSVSSSLNELKKVVEMGRIGAKGAVPCYAVQGANSDGESWPKGGPSEKRMETPKNEGAGLLLRGGYTPCFTEVVFAGERAQGHISASNWPRWARGWL